MLFGILSYLLVTILYYIIFILSLKIANVQASSRTNFSYNILGKFSFFFGLPLSLAFGFNFLYNSHSVIYQAFPIFMMVFWVFFLFYKSKDFAKERMIYLLLFIFFCMLIYLPLLVGKESFSSYRTMLALNFVVAFALLKTAIAIIKTNTYKNLFTAIIICCLISIGYRNFRFIFIKPLAKEYHNVNNYFNSNYHLSVDTIYFLRPPENIFSTLYFINPFNDEFGIASTFKDWTADPLMRQLIFEKTWSRETSENVKVIQFNKRKDFDQLIKIKKSSTLFFDIPFILKMNY